MSRQVKDIQQRFLTDPEFRIELVLINNPGGVAEALVKNNKLPDQFGFEEEQIRGAINEMILAKKYDELGEILAIVPVNKEALTPNAITALNTLPTVKSTNPWSNFTGNFGTQPGETDGNQEGGFDWGNMEFWGSIHNMVGGLFGIPTGQEVEVDTIPQTGYDPGNTTLTFRDKVVSFYYGNQGLVIGLGALIAAGVIWYIVSKRK